jgi:pimeloyl-ACP methyl ester carboxylesterase
MVLVHGANGDHDTCALIEGLLAERHSVWVYSRRGRGGSGDGPVYALEREVEDVLAVLAAAGDRPHLFGHSGGAVYCLLAAVQRPSVRSVVLYEPPLHLDRLDRRIVDDMQAALDAGNLDRALEVVFPAVGVVDTEVQVLRSLEPVWERLRAGVRLVPRELRTGFEAIDTLEAFDPTDIPTLYLFGGIHPDLRSSTDAL